MRAQPARSDRCGKRVASRERLLPPRARLEQVQGPKRLAPHTASFDGGPQTYTSKPRIEAPPAPVIQRPRRIASRLGDDPAPADTKATSSSRLTLHRRPLLCACVRPHAVARRPKSMPMRPPARSKRGRALPPAPQAHPKRAGHLHGALGRRRTNSKESSRRRRLRRATGWAAAGVRPSAKCSPRRNDSPAAQMLGFGVRFRRARGGGSACSPSLMPRWFQPKAQGP